MLNALIRVRCRPRLPRVRTTATVIAATALVLLAAACGSSPSSSGSGSGSNAGGSTSSQPTTSQKALAFAHCMPRARRLELPRPRQRRPHSRPRLIRNRSGFAAVRGGKPGVWEVPAPLHPLEFRLQRILPDNGVMSAATIRPRCALPAPDANRSPEARSSTGGTMVNDNRGWPRRRPGPRGLLPSACRARP